MKLSQTGMGTVKLNNIDEMYPGQSILLQTGQLVQYGAGIFGYNTIPLLLKKKIVTTNVTGPVEILENGKYGIIVDNSDEAIVDIMRKILKEKDIYKDIEKNLSNYKGDNEKIKKQTLNLLNLD